MIRPLTTVARMELLLPVRLDLLGLLLVELHQLVPRPAFRTQQFVEFGVNSQPVAVVRAG